MRAWRFGFKLFAFGQARRGSSDSPCPHHTVTLKDLRTTNGNIPDSAPPPGISAMRTFSGAGDYGF